MLKRLPPPRLVLRGGASSTAFILCPVNSLSFFFQSLSVQEVLPSEAINVVTSSISKYPYRLCLGMANISDLGSSTLATNRPGRPYRPKVSQVGKRNRRSISNPVTAGGTSGMRKMNPSVEDGGSEWMVMLPSILISVEASINDFACG